MALIRLDKLLADSGIASRSEAKALIRSGRVTVNGKIPRLPEEKYASDNTVIYVDGIQIQCGGKRYIMLYKPAGLLSATKDPRQSTVVDLLSPELRRQNLYPVGRLDKDTTGLLLLTNDGEFAHNIISPKKHISKVYRAELDGKLDEDDISAFANGIMFADGIRCLPAVLEILSPTVAQVTVYEGKYHQVKRMFAVCGKHVKALHRLSIGGLNLDAALAPGEYRELNEAERNAVFEN